MSVEDLIIIVLSGLGVFHGLFLAVILWNNKSALNFSNRILSVLMVILSIRIGKSVVLEFSKNLSLIYIYSGLCIMLFIGPLFYLYSRTLILKRLVSKKDSIHFLLGLFFILMAFPLQTIGFKNLPVLLVAFLFFIFYGHFLFYLLITKYKFIWKTENLLKTNEVKDWLNIIFYGLICIWIVYVLNLFEERIHYIIGPIVYSLTVYSITYLAIVKKYLHKINTVKYQTTNFNEEEINVLFRSIENSINVQKLFLEPDLSLAILSKQLRASSHKISLAVNTKSGYNFNEYVNRFRVAYAIEQLNKPEGKALTIAAIGSEAGFNSLSSFNQAFKKVTGKTPSAYRNGKTDGLVLP
jgi:AraC-like DNA-binding protein